MPIRSRSRSISNPAQAGPCQRSGQTCRCFCRKLCPGGDRAVGLGWEVLRALNPRLIYAQVKGVGEGSPYEYDLAFDMIALVCGGTMAITGERDRRHRKPGPTLGGTGTGVLLTIGNLGRAPSALHDRPRAARADRNAGRATAIHSRRFRADARSGQPAMRNGAKPLAGGMAPSGIYRCKPGVPNDYVYVFTTHANPEHSRWLLKVIGREGCSRIRASRHAQRSA
jgi:formyl-CoA transferase